MILAVPYSPSPGLAACYEGALLLMLASSFQRTVPGRAPLPSRFSGPKTGAKVQLFSLPASFFATFFQKIFSIILIY